ncbi:hypothetical protein HPB47_014575 [Ixodes persulcatus]|uniref:Uncharacterized protein n=1 Tax=Ixodes persulcatus TaxID=34615 RepID=A0AC60QWJ2_IXOPE|nr:hypothetical protein HPB47_014575 [Ixodes persulcatus]
MVWLFQYLDHLGFDTVARLFEEECLKAQKPIQDHVASSYRDERIARILRLQRRVDPGGAMGKFRQYLESRGAPPGDDNQMLLYCALPYVPNPKALPTFKQIFEGVAELKWKVTCQQASDEHYEAPRDGNKQEANVTKTKVISKAK